VMGLKIIPDIGERKEMSFEGCIGCKKCVEECPEGALSLDEQGEERTNIIDLSLCNGVACMRCERICSQKVFNLIKLITSGVKARQSSSSAGEEK
ncbi:MAG: 4Fe-4S dicluster domain-containing protein, partial [Anaerolineales bacterium]|nr:4Fe-4S dicluster domain-containing protein [Anaerolineales bacterium]